MAENFHVFPAPQNVVEEDGTTTTFPYRLKFPNSSLTDNGDGTTSVDFVAPLAGTYLKLDCSNDPLTASLDITGNLIATGYVQALVAGGSYIRMYHDGTTANIVSNAGDIAINPGGPNDILLQLGDALGVNQVSIEDSGGIQVAYINSDGYISGNNVHSANVVYTAYLQDNFALGAIDMTGDPWYMSGVSLEINENLEVNGMGRFNGNGNTSAIIIKSGERLTFDGA